MKAVLCKQYGPPDSLVVEELPSRRRPAPGEVVISVKAASLNFPDVLIIQNKYQFKPPLPFSPGSELAGVVKEVGEGVKGFRPGDKVIAFTTYGAFAEEVKTEASRLVPLPEKMDFVTGAAFLLTYATTDHALRDRGALAAGETLLVLGAAGGVGLAAIEIGKVLGARVIACASSEDKLAVCRSTAPTPPSTTPPRTCASASRRSPMGTASTWSTTRSAAPIPSPRSARSPGAAGFWWSASPPARSRSCRSTWRC